MAYASPVALTHSGQIKARTVMHQTNWSALSEATFDVGMRGVPLRMTEINYNPPGGGLYEFIELQNITATHVPLAGWRLRDGVDYDFPSNATLIAGTRLLVVGFDRISDTNALDDFRATYGLDAGVPLLGPWSGKLDNSAEEVELRQPVLYGPSVSHPVVERVRYRDAAPWPGADGDGPSLQRLAVTAYANDSHTGCPCQNKEGRRRGQQLIDSRIRSETVIWKVLCFAKRSNPR